MQTRSAWPFAACVVLLAAFGVLAWQAETAVASVPVGTTGPAPGVAQAPPADQGQGPLAANGFASPWCEDPGVVARLSATARSDCVASGVAAAPAPIGNYQFDVHIDSGPLGLGGTMFAIALQDLVLTPIWTALVWLVHALLVALEWCYSLDLLGGGALHQVAGALRTGQAIFTQPWLVLALAVAAVLLIYEGIVRRRVADSVGQAAVTAAMIVAGLWLIADPTGTVGEVSRTVNDASLGTVAAIDAGSPDHAERSVAGALGGVFETTVTAPWCYLEFGNVAWCSDPARVDPRLRAAAATLAADDRNQGAGRSTAALRLEASLLERARTNGEYFVALAANSAKRNSINDEKSLLRVICGTSDATACTGAAAAEAEFRTQSGTWPRAGGLLFVTIGTVGALALFGFLALRLLSAALLAVLYLLLAPVAVLAPAFGDGGRAAFRQWAARLLGALLTKLVYSVLLGVVLLMLRILLSLDALGWWTQWLLIAAFWWIAFLHRHQLLGQLFGEQSRHRPRGLPRAPTRRLMRFARVPSRAAASAAGTILERMRDAPRREGLEGGPQPHSEPYAGRAHQRDAPGTELDRSRGPHAGAGEAIAGLDPTIAQHALDDQLQRVLDADRADAAAIMRDAAGGGGGEDERRRMRLREQIPVAHRDGDARRLASLQMRLAGVDAGIQERQAAIREARITLAGSADDAAPAPAGAVRTGDNAPAASPRERRARDLDRQALLPRAVSADRASESGGRDYVALTALAGVRRVEYRRMAAAERRRVRLEIDRELERRREWAAAASRVAAGDLPRPAVRSAHERQFTREEFEQLVG